MTQNLPAYLQQYQAPDVGAALSQNLGSAMPPHVSIEGGRFTLVDASNVEIMVPTFDPGDPKTGRVGVGQYLDASIIDVNEHMSRMYYAKAYDPSNAGAPPDCWADNGIGPSIGASSPQSPTCAACPQAVWGSKVNANGKKVPACSQKQKTALLIPGFNTLFLLAVPPNSHSFMREYVEKCRGNNVNLANLITRISFVPGVQGTLMFSPVGYIDEPTAQLRQAAYAEKKTDALVGRNDVPRPGTGQIVQQQRPGMTDGQATQLEHRLQNPGAWPAEHLAPVQIQPASPVQRVATFGQHQQVQQPAPVQPQTGQWPVQTAQPAVPTDTGAGSATQPASSSEAPRRRRRTQAEIQAANGAPAGQPPATGAPVQQQAPFPHPGQTAAPPPNAAGSGGFPPSAQSGALPGQTDMGFGMASGQPAAANPELSTMLDDFFKG